MRRLLASLLLCALCSCEETPPGAPALRGDAALVPDAGDASDAAVPEADLRAAEPPWPKILPFRAVHLVGAIGRAWEEYDTRPRAQGGSREDITATLDQLRAIGVRQVIVQTEHAWSVETSESPAYQGTGLRSTVAYDARYRPEDPSTWGAVPRTRRADMGIVALKPPAAWDQPQRLATPLDINRKAEQVLGDLLDLVVQRGLTPVLNAQTFLQSVSENGYGSSFLYTDPSRDFDQFFRKYQEHLIAMARLCVRHGAPLLILGSETPYVAGAGQVRFANGESMSARSADLAARWRALIAAVRAAAAAEGHPELLLTYAELNPWWDPRQGRPPVPIWTRVPFWDQLDLVAISYYTPGRGSDVNGAPDTRPMSAADMVRYGQTHNFATDAVPNLLDLRAFFRDQRGYDLAKKPVLLTADGCTASPYGAANPAAPPQLRVGAAPDFEEQRSLYDSHFQLMDQYGAGWLGGVGFWSVSPTGRWGGAYNPQDPSNYQDVSAYFNFVNAPTQEVVRRYFSR